MKGPIAREKFRQQKSFKKPCRMRQMPLDRAGVRHGLKDKIFSPQRLAQMLRRLAHNAIMGREPQTVRWRRFVGMVPSQGPRSDGRDRHWANSPEVCACTI